jgi:hypothetical protein
MVEISRRRVVIFASFPSSLALLEFFSIFHHQAYLAISMICSSPNIIRSNQKDLDPFQTGASCVCRLRKGEGR